MKKVVILMISIFGTILLSACQQGRTLEPAEGARVPYLDGGWVNVWYDEFDGDTLNLDKWSYEIGGGGWGNNELQYYTYSNTEVSDGTLKIHVRNESHQNREYTSARIVTRGQGDFRYGRFQASIKLPGGTGMWPAFWMMPTHSVYGGWPHSGEIDIMEYVGKEPGVGHSTIHTSRRNGMNGQMVGFNYPLENETTEFNLFEIIWLPGTIRSYLNGEFMGQFTYTPAFFQNGPYHETWPFDQEFFMILNVAVGGNWGGPIVDPDIFPNAMEVEYVRVYQLDAAYVDREAPNEPINIRAMNNYTNSLFWVASDDDTGIDYYEIYVNDVFYTTSAMNQVTLEDFEVGQNLAIKIRAIDLSGKRSIFSESFTYTFR